jgi:hypothetical protein
MIVYYTHGEYCDVPSAPCACNSRVGTAAPYPGRRYPDANALRRLEQRLRETGSVTLMLHVNTGRPRTVRTQTKGDTITAAVEREVDVSHEN